MQLAAISADDKFATMRSPALNEAKFCVAATFAGLRLGRFKQRHDIGSLPS
jgi:hypothetical protein